MDFRENNTVLGCFERVMKYDKVRRRNGRKFIIFDMEGKGAKSLTFCEKSGIL